LYPALRRAFRADSNAAKLSIALPLPPEKHLKMRQNLINLGAQTLDPSSRAEPQKAAHQQRNNHTNDDPSRKMAEVESPAESVALRNEQAPVPAVEIENAESPVIRIVVGE
jgi:hypothetical protein